ncbi:hypothetical protein [Halopseudomonas oceani]|nr:hypothetical protein [Halopseudomonas oceani]
MTNVTSCRFVRMFPCENPDDYTDIDRKPDAFTLALWHGAQK